MNKIKYISVLLIFVWLFSSCEDALEIEPKEFLSPAGFEIENDITLALTGTYKALTGMGVVGGDYQNIDPVINDFITDNGFMDKSWMGAVEFWDQGQNQNSALASRKWTRNYMGILRANTVLAYIDQVPFTSSELKRRMEAEARFLRAFFYGDLIMFFGDVPLRILPEGLEDQHKARTSQTEILEFIYSELDAAIPHLPGTYSENDRGRVTKGAAYTLKAWLALNYYDYQTVIDASEKVISSGIYELYPNYRELFLQYSEANNKEVIFDAQYLEGKTEELLTSPWTTYFYAWSSYQADYSLAKEFYMKDGSLADESNPVFDPQNPFQNRDPRLSFTLTLPYSFDGFTNSTDSNFFIPYIKKAFNFSSLRIRKWVDYDEEHNLRGLKQSGTNIIFFRYADLLLMRAEALCELNGQGSETEILALINAVRQRPDVRMPKVEDSEGIGLTQEQLRAIIRHERRVELAFEGSRILDIKRWDIGQEAYSDAVGYDPNDLYWWVIQQEDVDQIESDGAVDSKMIRYLGSTKYLLNVVFKSEQDFIEGLEEVFSPANRFTKGEAQIYADTILSYVEPKYNLYSFRSRTFNETKGYLWPIPFTEIQSNNLINTNNPGY